MWRRFLLYSIPSLIFCLGGSLWLSYFERQKHFNSVQRSEKDALLVGISLAMDSVSAELLNMMGDLEILATDEEFRRVLRNDSAAGMADFGDEWLTFSRAQLV